MEKELLFYDGATLNVSWDAEGDGSVVFSAPVNTGDVERVRRVWVSASGWAGNALTAGGSVITIGGKVLMAGVASPADDALTHCLVVRQAAAGEYPDALLTSDGEVVMTSDGEVFNVKQE